MKNKINNNIVFLFMMVSFLILCFSSFSIANHKHPYITNNLFLSTYGVVFDAITRLNDNCILISGNAYLKKDFFVESCVKNWKVKVIDRIGYVNDMKFLTEQNGWVVIGGSIARSIDRKFIYDVDIANNDSYFRKVFFINSKNGWAVGMRGRVVATIDYGKTWKEQNSGTDFTLDEIIFITPDKGWITGYYVDPSNGKTDSILLQTNNGGNTWEKIDLSKKPFFHNIFFIDSKNGWGITDVDGEMIKTTDSGKNWKKLKYDKKVSFKDIYFLDKYHGWAVKDGIFFTSNGGKTWKLQDKIPELDSPYLLDKILFLNKRNGWAMGLDEILQTTDGGKTWNLLKVSEYLAKIID